MTLQLELTPEQERRLQADAKRAGLEIDEYALSQLFKNSLPQKNQALADLMQQWIEEDSYMDPLEAETAEADWETLQRGLNANRAQSDERLIFP